MKTGRVALPATAVAAMGGPAMVLCLAGASPIATVATLRSADTWRPTAGPEVVVPAVAAIGDAAAGSGPGRHCDCRGGPCHRRLRLAGGPVGGAGDPNIAN